MTIMVKIKYKAWYIVVKFENNPLRIVGNIKLLVFFHFWSDLELDPKLNQLELLLVCTITQNLKMIY